MKSFLQFAIRKFVDGDGFIIPLFSKHFAQTGYRMSIWDTALNFVFEMEGGYSNDPNDAGGETNFGISKRRYPNEDIKNMTKERAGELYRKDFWEFCHCDELPPRLAVVMFDAAVNQGEEGAVKMLQIALGVAVDGVMGTQTITSAYKAGNVLIRKLLAQRMARYTRTILHRPSDERWLENWSRRLMMCAELAYSLSA